MATDYKLRISAKDNTKGGFNSVNKNVNKTQQSMKKLAGAFASAFAIRQIVQFGNESLQLADSIGKTADSIGITTDFLQKYQYAAQQSGIETEQFNKALRFFSKGVGEAAQGTGLAKRAFEEMGLSIKDSSGQTKKSEDLFKEFFVSLESIQEPFERNALLAQVFGAKVGITMANLIKDGVVAMDDLAESATGVFTDETIRNAEKFNDMMNRLNRKILTPLRSKMIDIAAAYFTVAEGMGLIEADPVVQSLEEMNQAFTNSQTLILAYGNTLRTNKNLTKDQQKEIFEMLVEEMKLRDELGKKIQRINKNTADSTKSSFDVIKASLEKFEESLGTVDERLGKAAVGSMKKFEDSIVNSLKAGKLEFKDFSNYVIEQLIRIAIQEAILAPLKGTFTSFFSNFGELFGGGKADGGAVKGGTPYMVGERGAEMFVPNSSGQIITNENIKQQGQPQSAPTVNFNISTVDAAGFDQLLASRKGLITQIINNAMNTQGKIGVA